MSELIYKNDPSTRERARQIVEGGGVIAFRTDTFYGLGVNPLDPFALERLNELKGREGKPILLLISRKSAAERFITDENEAFRHLAEKFWPGALTLVAKARAELPQTLTAGTGTIGVRLPDDEEARALVDACGGALTATSANPAGRTPASEASEVAAYLARGLDLIIDGGSARTDQPSTVLDTSRTPALLIREGVVKRETLAASLEEIGVGLTTL